jgi:hypothetical protein
MPAAATACCLLLFVVNARPFAVAGPTHRTPDASKGLWSRFGKKGQISPLLTVDGATPAGVDLHTDSTESIAGPLASARPRYTHTSPRPHLLLRCAWSLGLVCGATDGEPAPRGLTLGLPIRCSSITQNHTPASHREFPDSLGAVTIVSHSFLLVMKRSFFGHARLSCAET